MIFYSNTSKITDDIKSSFFLLNKDEWNDRGYKTGFVLKYYSSYNEYKNMSGQIIGYVKIGQKGMEHDASDSYLKNAVTTKFSNSPFESLSSEYFSLGQDSSYYSKIKQLFDIEEQKELLTALKDVVYLEDLLQDVKAEKVFKSSLIRNLSIHTIEGEFKNLVQNISATQTVYNLNLQISTEIAETPMIFEVIPSSIPPTNLHAIIGRNGVGKSFFFKSLINSMCNIDLNDRLEFSKKEKKYVRRYFSKTEGLEDISSVLAIDFSAFDSTMPKKTVIAVPENNKIRYTFIGFPFSENKKNKINEALSDEYEKLKEQIMLRDSQVSLLKTVLEILESDPMFKSNDIQDWFSNKSISYSDNDLFKRLSSGHKICLLMILELVLNVEVNSLVLIDEPELHLHPPLLSSLMKAINHILRIKNAIGIIATHSPVVIQEINKNCVWIINREKHQIRIDRPRIETFGENINTLTREVFGLEVRNSGYELLIQEVINNSNSFDDVLKKFDGNLSENAQMIAMVLWEAKK